MAVILWQATAFYATKQNYKLLEGFLIEHVLLLPLVAVKKMCMINENK